MIIILHIAKTITSDPEPALLKYNNCKFVAEESGDEWHIQGRGIDCSFSKTIDLATGVADSICVAEGFSSMSYEYQPIFDLEIVKDEG